MELFAGVGSDGDNFTNTVLDDEAGTAIAAGTAPFTGNYRPVGSLAALDGQLPNGTWQLEITDAWGGRYRYTHQLVAHPDHLRSVDNDRRRRHLCPDRLVPRQLHRGRIATVWLAADLANRSAYHTVEVAAGQIVTGKNFGNCEAVTGSIDADGNGAADALSDGILILRYLFDPTGLECQRRLGQRCHSYHAETSSSSTAQTTALDADGNGTADALSDGILILRYLFDPAGAWNVDDALGLDNANDPRGDQGLPRHVQPKPVARHGRRSGGDFAVHKTIAPQSDSETTSITASPDADVTPRVPISALDIALQSWNQPQPVAARASWPDNLALALAAASDDATDLDWFLSRRHRPRSRLAFLVEPSRAQRVPPNCSPLATSQPTHIPDRLRHGLDRIGRFGRADCEPAAVVAGLQGAQHCRQVG